MKKVVFLALALLGTTTVAEAAVKTKTINYTHDGVTLKGYLAWDDAAQGKRPGVLVVHEWWGLDNYARKRAEQLAGLGYVALAVDMYGEGKTTEHPKEASKMAGEVRSNMKTWMGRAKAGLKVLREQEMVDPSHLAAIGYCFGGSTVQKLAFSGADLDAVVSFHGAIVVPTADEVKAIKGRMLICHGAEDKFIPEKSIEAFKSALDAGKANYRFESYPGAVHSFTVPGADARGIKGIAYNEAADRQSWASMQSLFKEVFGKKK